MKYAILAAIGMAIWVVVPYFLPRGGPTWDLDFLVAKIKAVGSRIHYTMGIVASVILIYLLLRFIIGLILVYR